MCNGNGIIIFFLIIISSTMISTDNSWRTDGCHLFNYTQVVSIPKCYEFNYTSLACGGYCESSAVPTNPKSLNYNERQVITSISSCCDMATTAEEIKSVYCLGGIKNVTFRIATSCACMGCQKDSDSK